MVTARSQVDTLIKNPDTDREIVKWEPRYETGIELIDEQHKELLSLTNDLYRACLTGSDEAGAVFKESMTRMVNYVRFHFSTEQQLLQKVGYPQYLGHKKLHESLTKSILDAAKEYNEGRKFVPNNFVRTLKDWIFSHIAIEDKAYALYVAEQKRKGFLTARDLEG